MTTIETITQRLQTAFTPLYLQVIDDKEKHIGHAGSQNGAGHYTILIQADSFKNKSRIDVHREIYRVLADLIPEFIHAVSIKLTKSK